MALLAIPFYLSAQINQNEPSKIEEFKAEKLFITGLDQYERGNYRAAIDFFNQVISLNPHHQRVYELRGESHFKLGNYNSAIADYEQATYQHPQNSELRNSMGVSAAYLKQYRAAATFFYEALQIDPGHKGAQTNLKIANQHLQEIGEEPFQNDDYPDTWSNDDWNSDNKDDDWDIFDKKNKNDNPLIDENNNSQFLDTDSDDVESKPLVRTYSKSEIVIGNRNDPYITIERIKITENSTRITFSVKNISGEIFPINLDRRNGPNAFYLTDRGFQKIYKLKKVYSLKGWPNSPYPLRPREKNKIFTVEFDRLDDDVESFHILEGKSDRAYAWDFWDVELKNIP